MADERRPGWVEHLGLEEEAREPGVVACRLAVTETHQNIQGVIHGSVPIALLDTAMGHALDGLLEEGEFCSTTQISFQFLAATRPGDVLEAVGRVVRKGRRIAYLEGHCRRQDGTEVVRAQGTWYVGRVRPPAPDPTS